MKKSLALALLASCYLTMPAANATTLEEETGTIAEGRTAGGYTSNGNFNTAAPTIPAAPAAPAMLSLLEQKLFLLLQHTQTSQNVFWLNQLVHTGNKAQVLTSVLMK